MADTFVKIRIQSEADLVALSRAGLEIKGVETAAKSASSSLGALAQSFAIGVGSTLTQSFAQIPNLLIEATKQGIAFNANLYDSEKAISALIERFQGLSTVAADDAAAGAMAKIVDLEPKVAGSLDTLVNGFQVALAASKETGFSIEENVEIVGKLANAMGKLKLPLEQFPQEAGSIFSGNITSDSVLAKRLTITPAEVASAKQAGELFGFLKGKIGSLGDATDNFATSATSLQSNLDKLRGVLTKPLFDEAKKGIDTVNAASADPEAQRDIQAWGLVVKDVVEVTKNIAPNAFGALGSLIQNLFPNIGVLTRGAQGLKDVARAKLDIPDKPVPARDFEIDPVRGGGPAPVGTTAQEQAAFIRANKDLASSTELFAESGRNAEAALQAKIEALTRLRESFAKETGLAADFAAEQAGTATSDEGGDIATQTRQKEALAEILKLSTAINSAAQDLSKSNAEALQAEDERKAKAREALAELKSSLEIERARLDGNDELVTKLETQRDLEKEIARIQSSQLDPAEKDRATDLARRTSQLQQQLALKRQLNAQENARGKSDDDLAVLKAAGHRSRGGKERAEAKRAGGDVFRELKPVLGEDEARARASETERRTLDKLRSARGGIGGEATPASPENNRGAINTRDIFRKATPPAAELLGPAAPAASAAASVFRQSTPQIGELFGPPAPASGAGAGGDGAVEKAATSVQGGGSQISKAADRLSNAGSNLQGAGGDLMGAAGTLEGAANTLTSAASALERSFSNFASTIANFEGRIGNLEDRAGS